MKERRFASARDLIIVFLVFALAGVFLIYRNKTAVPGITAIVTIVGRETMYISLEEDGIYSIDTELPVTLEVKDGAIHFINSLCPDHICENDGYLSREGEQATCMPAGVSVIIMDD